MKALRGSSLFRILASTFPNIHTPCLSITHNVLGGSLFMTPGLGGDDYPYLNLSNNLTLTTDMIAAKSITNNAQYQDDISHRCSIMCNKQNPCLNISWYFGYFSNDQGQFRTFVSKANNVLDQEPRFGYNRS
jgi:hypothetical protein